jgi:hypothetical protein
MRIGAIAALSFVLVACGAPIPPGEPRTPPDGPAAEVLAFYLGALRAGDCAMAARVAAETFRQGNGELCGAVTVTDFTVNPDPAKPSALEAEFGVSMVTSGSTDGSIPAGRMTWFFDLQRQGDGRWLLIGGGSGP